MRLKFLSANPWGKLSTAKRLADEVGFVATKPGRWFGSCGGEGVVDVHGRWVSSAIEVICARADVDFCAALKVVIRCEDGMLNPFHCVAIVDNMLVDPDDMIRRELCVESFTALKIVKILDGFQFVKKNQNRKRKRDRDTAPVEWWCQYGATEDPGPFLP